MTNKIPKIVPRGKWILVQRVEDDARENENGLIIPSSVEKEQKTQGTVLAVGSEIKDIVPGDIVVYATFVGEIVKTRIKGKEEERVLVLDEDIIAFIKN